MQPSKTTQLAERDSQMPTFVCLRPRGSVIAAIDSQERGREGERERERARLLSSHDAVVGAAAVTIAAARHTTLAER